MGGTLIEPYPSVGEVYTRVARRFGIEANPREVSANFSRAWKTKVAFNHSRAAWSELVRASFQNLGEISTECFDAIYNEFAQPSAWRIYPDVVPILESLSSAKKRLGIISNWDERLRPLLNALKLSDYFESIIISQEVGYPKPRIEIFHAAAEAFRIPASNILHIGDGRKEDYEGARAAGFKAIHLDRSKNAATGSIRSLADLPQIIE